MRLLVSVLFWLSLFAAAFLFGSAVLAPSYAQWHATREALLRGQRSLIELEREVRWLRRAVAVRSRPPQSDALAIDGEQITLPLPAPSEKPARADEPAAPEPPPYGQWLLFVAAHPRLQTRFLLAAALLVLTGFTMLNDSAPGDPADLPPVRRYWRAPPPQATGQGHPDGL